ncbi:plasmid partitioning protein RepB C-terminal domain-containing protein [Bradyrhizobium sp. AZCC 2289]|uniref:plasmid partitioning protein RepB C-terminal domain-containing protein n=1 Tax=Bradyrhizobium sp. AZCC 2289 TaxID=3117026 RepID=UPI002FEF80B2
MAGQPEQAVELIQIDRITIANPRVRNKRSFRELADSISELGLKKPITVTLRDGSDGPRYDLVCGQGRMEAYQALGQTEIPAFVIDAEPEDRMVKSLVENCARRHHGAIDLLHDIEGMKQRGHVEADIARKTGLSLEYVRGVTSLLEKGEQRLLRAVESGNMPVSVAVAIADADDSMVQDALQQAYEQKLLRGRKLLIAKRLVENRRRRGKGLRVAMPKRTKTLSSGALVRAYKESTDRKRLLVRKADSTRSRLIFMTEAFRNLLDDENFVTLLRAEKLETLPRNLADRIQRGEAA